MKRTLLGLLAATALTAAIPAVASAQSINDRQNSLFTRIDAGVQSGQLTRVEADRLRSDFYALNRLEQNYRASAPGLTNAERDDLNRRFDVLSSRIQYERRDDDRYARDNDRYDNGRNDDQRYANWVPIDQRQDNLFRRIEQGERNGRLTPAESARLRTDFNVILRLEADYRRNGLTVAERADLDRRMDLLSERINAARNDRDGRTNISQRIAQLSSAIDRAIRNGRVDRREARELRAEQRELARFEAAYRPGGFTNAERAELARRADRLENMFERDTGQQYGWNNGAYQYR